MTVPATPEKTAPEPKIKVYIDTMAFVYKLVNTRHRYFPQANAFFRDIELGKFVGVISTFELAEFQSAIKSILSQRRNAEMPQGDVDKEMGRLNDFIDKMGIKLYNADVVLDTRPLVAFFRAEQLIGAAKSIKGTWRPDWHTIGGADATHLTIAETIGVESYATFDQGFKGVNGTSVKMLILSEAYP